MNCATKSQKALPSIALATSTCKSSTFMCSSPLPLCSRQERLACASQPQDQDNGRCHFCRVTFCCHHLSPTLAASQSACQVVAERGNKPLGKDSLPLLLWVREKTKARRQIPTSSSFKRRLNAHEEEISRRAVTPGASIASVPRGPGVRNSYV